MLQQDFRGSAPSLHGAKLEWVNERLESPLPEQGTIT